MKAGLSESCGLGGRCSRVGGVTLAPWRRLLPLWALVLLGVLGFGPPSLGDGDVYATPLTSAELGALRAAPLVPQAVRSVAVIVVDATTGHALLARNADARLAPASLTKMMTALVALDHASLTDTITATTGSMSEPSLIGLAPGDSLPLEDMLYGLLLPSGNDAALAIAETVGRGSVHRFVGWMNERAELMGLRNTRFANPTGLDESMHYSSARDLALIAREVMTTPVLARIVGTERHVVPGAPRYVFSNSNPLLGANAGVDGIKTGFTDEAGRCLAGSVVRDGHRVISVVLNSPDVAQETLALVDAGLGAVRWTELEVQRAGFASVRYATRAVGHRPVVALGEWERPFLRAFRGRMEARVWIGEHLLARWSEGSQR